MKRWLFPIAALVLYASTAAAITIGGKAPTPLGYLDHGSDMRWRFFLETKVVENRVKGIYLATFAPYLTRIDNTKFSISGFMMPLDTNHQTRHFILTRRNANCPFCPPNEPTEAIEVFTDTPVAISDSAVTVEGRFKLVSRSTKGLFYQLESAKLL